MARGFDPIEHIPAIEVVPGPLTDRASLDLVRGWLRQLGRIPVVLRKEIPGNASGKVTRKNVETGPAPRSAAASFSDGSSPDSRAFTTIATYETVKTTCASTTVVKLRCTFISAKLLSSATPSTISGTITGR